MEDSETDGGQGHSGQNDIDELTEASDSVDVQGDRYPAAMQAMVDLT
jgi:hypothetical protein